MNPTTLSRALASATATILRALVRILLRHGIGYGTFAENVRKIYVEVASEPEFRTRGRKPSKSHIAVITGLSRKEVLRLSKLAPPDDFHAAEHYNRAARVVSGWVRDPRFRDRRGGPALLPVEGEVRSFRELVRSFSGDAPYRAVLDELVRVRVAEIVPDGRVRLLEHSYIPRDGDIEKVGILGRDSAEFITTIDHNIRRPDATYLQRKVSYDNLPAEALPALRELAKLRAQSLLEFFDGWMSERDRDVNPDAGGTGRKRAGIGVYYFEDEGDGEETR